MNTIPGEIDRLDREITVFCIYHHGMRSRLILLCSPIDYCTCVEAQRDASDKAFRTTRSSGCFVWLLSLPVCVTDLLQTYSDALLNDSVYASARAQLATRQ